MKEKTKPLVVPKLPKRLMDDLASVVNSLHGRPITIDVAAEFQLTEKQAEDLFQYLCDIKMISLKWLAEKQSICFIRQKLTN